MSAISAKLLKTIRELQQLPSLAGSALGGGTSLAIRYGHRKSTDIDIFFPGQINRSGFEAIEQEVKKLYGANILGLDYPCDLDDQFVFLRFFVRKGNETIKVEIMQNIIMLDAPEDYEGIKMVTQLDVALFKLMAAANRASEKDIYDLDHLTEHYPLPNIFSLLAQKQQQYADTKYHNIFDQDSEISPVQDPMLMLKFDQGAATSRSNRPQHSQSRVDIMPKQKTWLLARTSWRRKVRGLFNDLNIDFPSPLGQ